jgi:hypothetical protein
MNDRLGDEQLGALLGQRMARQATSISPRPDDEALFARVGARAARQRRTLAAAAVVAVTVSSFAGYVIGTTNRHGDSIVQTPAAPPTDPGTSAAPPPAPGDAAYDGPLEHVFTRTANGITVRVYASPEEPGVPAGFILAEMSNDEAVGVGRAENCWGMGIRASGTFGGPEGAPVEWVIVQSFDGPDFVGASVRAEFDGGADDMVPVGGIAVLVAQGAGGTVSVSGAGVHTDLPAASTIGAVIETPEGNCLPPTPATLPPAGAQPADVAAAEAGVRQAYVDVYDNYQPGETDAPVRQALQDAGFTDEQLAAMTVEVGEVRFTDETHAAVLFRLTIPGHMDGTQDWRLGYAVLQDGRWTQAQETNCDDLRSINVGCPEQQ